MTAGWATPFNWTDEQAREVVAEVGERTGTQEQREQFARAVGAVLKRGQTRLFMPDLAGQAKGMHQGAATVLESLNAEAADLTDEEADQLRALVAKVAEATAEAGTMERRGASKKDHQTLAELAQVWRFAFGRWPSAKPTAPFMRVVLWINARNYADLPTGNGAKAYIGQGTK
ncbi:hypothetical protein ACN2MM_04555 [Alkalilimnicola ehrlichii MLHE-1]|uniref:Uncharacterized protein n=1 Tax=Alkalilimnicola ehrlichii (strain ATCC BAA-1101 / DSM 17681 / MLHE-1) TaxID=187272 RepID=Q0AAJ3_ALKEH|nr:hypothetical protein [Alkalilimnicola ehrlichii]ABI56144.1 hypothetical protein Mlg_0790 [Alkalilimnicola ehrlichii MLHE-1]